MVHYIGTLSAPQGAPRADYADFSLPGEICAPPGIESVFPGQISDPRSDVLAQRGVRLRMPRRPEPHR